MTNWTPEDWVAWTAALARPAYVDDEEAPQGVRLIPWWNWALALASIYRVDVDDIERVPSQRPVLTLPEVLYGQHLGPVPSDWCLTPLGDYFGCNRSCS